jgi:hypothetical protein
MSDVLVIVVSMAIGAYAGYQWYVRKERKQGVENDVRKKK